MEKQITLSLDEYNKLLAENKRMKKLLDGKPSLVGIKSITLPMDMGYRRDTWNVLSENEVIGPMAVRIKELEDENFDLNVEARRLKEELNRKPIKESWWHKKLF